MINSTIWKKMWSLTKVKPELSFQYDSNNRRMFFFFSQTQNCIVTEMYNSICIHDQRNKKEERIVAIKSTRQCLPCCFPLDQAPVFQKEMNWTFLFVSFDLWKVPNANFRPLYHWRKKRSSAPILWGVLWRNNSETSDYWFIFQLFWVMGVPCLNFKEPINWNSKMHFGDLGVVYSLKTENWISKMLFGELGEI